MFEKVIFSFIVVDFMHKIGQTVKEKCEKKSQNFDFWKMASNVFYMSEIHPKPLWDTHGVLRNQFWDHRHILSNFLKIEFLT